MHNVYKINNNQSPLLIIVKYDSAKGVKETLSSEETLSGSRQQESQAAPHFCLLLACTLLGVFCSAAAQLFKAHVKLCASRSGAFTHSVTSIRGLPILGDLRLNLLVPDWLSSPELLSVPNMILTGWLQC